MKWPPRFPRPSARTAPGSRAIGTVECHCRTLRAALSTAQRRGLSAVNPALDRMDALPNASPDAGRELAVWESAKIASFLEFVTVVGDRLAACTSWLTNTGLGRGELYGLGRLDRDVDGVA